jgi:hypothetical protein
MKTYGRVEGIAPPFLISALDGGEWSAAALPPGERAPLFPLDRRLGGPQSQSELYGEEKNLALAKNGTLAIQPVARRYTIWAILALICFILPYWCLLCKLCLYCEGWIFFISFNTS